MTRHLAACNPYLPGSPCYHRHGLEALTATDMIAACGVLLAVLLAWGLLTRGRPPAAPREPRTDFPPFLYDLASGSRHDAYTAPVSAVTPAGIRVRRARCCPGGHQSPAQAIAHAARVRDRIGRTGR